jgi:outer membrane protein OmpA-like peptidoglycan-associated protein/tetratricopeptide (TPR) repeat protein
MKIHNGTFNSSKKYLIMVLLVVFAIRIQAQDMKKVKQLYKEAETHLLYEEYELALPLYQEIIGEGWENSNIYLSIGMCYLNTQTDVKDAIPYLEKAVLNISPNYKEGNYKEEGAPEEAWFYLAKSYRIDGQFDKAIEAYEKFKSFLSSADIYYNEFVDLQIETCNTAKRMMSSPVNFIGEELKINQEGENYFPAVAGNEKSMAFTAYQEVYDEYIGNAFFEVIYFSESDGHDWKKPKDISQKLASDGYFSTAYLSYNGDYMLLYRDDYGNGNIYYSEKSGGSWNSIERMPKQISSRYNETHASISKDGNTLFFVSDRPGGYGYKDIYKIEKDSKGRWGTAENLGDVINTQFEEETPFLAEDGRTLYFASEAHNSMGGYDIFKSVSDENGNWSEPQNLGYPINSAADDVFYLPIGDGSVAYMSRLPEGGDKKKIFRIEYPKTERIIDVVADNVPDNSDSLDTTTSEIQTGETGTQSDNQASNTESTYVPEVKTIVVPSEYELKGRITLEDNQQLDPSFYIHVTKPDGEVVAALSPDITTGEFRGKVKHGSYTVKAFGEGYQPAEKNIFISADQQSEEVLTFLQMVPLSVSSGEYFTIKNIFFDYNSEQLNRESQIEIEKLAKLMEKNPSLYIEVVGNTDAHGTEEYNKNLSLKRARAVVDYVHSKGIDNSRFVTKGMGKENFIAINQNPDGSDNPEGRRLNRRVEIKIIKSNNDNISIEDIYVPDELKYKDQMTYTIFLMETQKPLELSYFKQSGSTISNVWMFQTEAGYLYTVGKFNHQSEALELMNLVVDAGFPDARVISNLDYNELVQKSANFYKSKMSETDRTVYTVQLYALKNPKSDPAYKGLTDVDKIICNDGYTRYVWGEFIGRTSARQALQSAIEKGFYDAFIVEVNKFKN